jgi:hypothetical protein
MDQKQHCAAIRRMVHSGNQLFAVFLGLRPTLRFGLRVADGLGQHLAQLGLRLRVVFFAMWS